MKVCHAIRFLILLGTVSSLALSAGCITNKGKPVKTVEAASTADKGVKTDATAAQKKAADLKAQAEAAKKKADAEKAAAAKKKADEAKKAGASAKKADADKAAAEAKKKADAAKKKADAAKKKADAAKAAAAKKSMSDQEKKIAKAQKKHGHDWSYEDPIGPAAWGKLKKEWAIADSGKAQSPIDITGAAADASLPALEFAYQPTKVHLEHNGHTIKVQCDEGSTMTLGGKVYKLDHFHFHSPSEHTVDGKSFPLEMHMVHKADNGELAVLGLLFYEGRENTFLKNFWNDIPMREGKAEPPVTVHPIEPLPFDLSYYAYDGSLTTPPCTEGVKWRVLKVGAPISTEQIKDFQRIFKNNNRPVQPLNGRKVGLKGK